MKCSEMVTLLQAAIAKHGDIDFVYHDMDTSYYFALMPEDVEVQTLKDGSRRVSVKPDGYWSKSLSDEVVGDRHSGV